MARLPDPRPTLDAPGKAIYKRLAGSRGALGGMYLALMHHPVLAEHVGALGTYLRFHGLLPGDVRELAILATAHSLGAAFEWKQHLAFAREAGLPQEIIDRVRRNDVAGATVSRLHSDVWRTARHMAAQEDLPKALQRRLEKALGLGGVVELVALCGFYRCVATIGAAFDVSL